jgi:hypothetical protein
LEIGCQIRAVRWVGDDIQVVFRQNCRVRTEL